MIIDIDHWRHFYLLLGLAWGIIAVDARYSAQKRALFSPSAGSTRQRVARGGGVTRSP